jgi:hypothetical protein
MSHKAARIFKYSVATTYLVIMTSALIVLTATFPGYLNDGSFEKFKTWHEDVYYWIQGGTNISWLLLTFLSTVTAITAIFKILKVIRSLEGHSVCKLSLRLHMLDFIMLSLVVAIACIPYDLIPSEYFTLESILTTVVLIN